MSEKGGLEFFDLFEHFEDNKLEESLWKRIIVKPLQKVDKRIFFVIKSTSIRQQKLDNSANTISRITNILPTINHLFPKTVFRKK